MNGGDDRRVLLWRVEQAIQGIGKPTVMRAEHSSNIFCLGYDNSKSKIFSAGNDDQVIVHNLQTGDPLNFFLHEKPVYGLSIHPHNDFVFASACDDGRVLIYDIRGSTESLCLAQYKSAFHSVMFSPIDSKILATANAKEGVSLWDIRKPLEPVLRYGTDGPSQSCMYVRFNSAGNRLLALRRRLPPVLYSVDSPKHLCQFDHRGYYNSCTMKSCCFAGDNDEYVLSGSDDFNLYMWKIPTDDTQWVDSAHMKLCGHRSIVNQVRYNQSSCILASSGVEKIIKIWSPFPLGYGSLGGLKRESGKQEKQRRVFAHNEYIDLVLRRGHFMTHDYSHQSTREDPRMMAFFDSLVQREIEGWSSGDVTAPQTPSDTDNLNARNSHNGTDSDDSLDLSSDRQLMLTILGPTVNSRNSSTGMAPERPSESPNRITRLIANRRTKLMRLAGMETSETNTPNTPATSTTVSATNGHAGESSCVSETVAESSRTKSKSKSKSKLKGAKRKLNKSSSRSSRTRRSAAVEFQTEEEVDATQPSTSSGVISRRSRYTSTPVECNPRNSSSSSSDDNDIESSVKRKTPKTDSDSSSKTHRRKHRKCKNNVMLKIMGGKNSRKKQKVENETDEEWWKDMVNGSKTDTAERQETPVKRTSRIPPTSDSGITSGVSTAEKSRASVQNNGKDSESSDHEQNLKSLENFRKKVDATKRSYRKRTQSVSSDSSD
ncbi:DDB1- and CUL4-associated factor 5 isoform X2 [Belonocnema kinseyi]|uniref:DDB1- and CUL4-associated factor 5 isoform X2 n=1 Tax=Belonocnema kinseyi TaxID=2817044 RepID=UPI00143D5C9F|nr:DDB1- and CUL4-associated factor 5 isoform X2 [Belonocnema kinseyi]